jgi:periplasmic divalent cation tolerance protein
MDQVIHVFWSAANHEEARQISRSLVEKKLVACAQISSEVESIYIWKDELKTASEVKVYLKTIERHFSQIEEYIIKNASYDLPEILKTSVSGSKLYLKWVVNNVG